DWTGPSGRLARLTFRMRRPMCVGDTLVFDGTVESVDDGYAEVALRLTVDGETATEGGARIAVPRAEGDKPWRRPDWRPCLVSCVLAPRLAPAELLPGIAGGETIVTLAWHEPDGGSGPDGVRMRADDGTLTGTKILVPYASAATDLLVLARTDDGVGLFRIDP